MQYRSPSFFHAKTSFLTSLSRQKGTVGSPRPPNLRHETNVAAFSQGNSALAHACTKKSGPPLACSSKNDGAEMFPEGLQGSGITFGLESLSYWKLQSSSVISGHRLPTEGAASCSILRGFSCGHTS